MEQLNKVELRGILGVIRVQNVGEKRLATMSVATNYCYKGGDGCPVIETTWHIVTAWEGGNCRDLDLLQKGDNIHVTGRLRCRRYMDSAGIERTQTEVVASNLEKVEGN